MQKIRFFKQHTVDTLKQGIKQNLSWYRNEESEPLKPDHILDEYREMSLSIDPTCFNSLNGNASEKQDIKNVITIYQALDFLSLQQVADERIWTYATHVLAKKYVFKRWTAIPEDDDKAVKYINTHYFVSDARSLIRDNAVSRLWWMGYIASRCSDYSLEETLDILLRNPDVRANLLERASLSSSSEIFSAVIRSLGKSLEKSNSPEIYKREKFRLLMKNLNQRGGRIMLNALHKTQLDNVIDDMVNEVIRQDKTT